MVGGGTRTSQDIPPFSIAAREPVAYCGLNNIGLRRRGFKPEVVEAIHNAYRILYQNGKLLQERIEEIRNTVPAIPEVQYLLDFVTASSRGIIPTR